MNYTSLKNLLMNEQAIEGLSFQLLRSISNLINRPETVSEGRDLIIRALAKRHLFSVEEQKILGTLLRRVGLFPYLSDLVQSVGLSEHLALELHRPPATNDEVVFHSLQYKIFSHLLAGHNVVLSAATSVGKTTVIDALISTKNYRKIVVVVPTLALIDEIRSRLKEKFKNELDLITHPSQVENAEKPTVYILTQERVLQRDDLSDIELFIIDEFYKMDLAGDEDEERVVDLNLAFHKLEQTGAQFYLLGPNISSVGGLSRSDYYFIPSDMSTVAVDISQYNLPTNGEERPRKLLELCNSLSGPTIVYCQSPASAARVAKTLIDSGNFTVVHELEKLVNWVSENYHPEWIVSQSIERGIGIHHGGIPRSLQQYIINLFNGGSLNLLICTSTIIEGVNTAAENVIIYDRRKNTSVIDYFTYKNIVGRAGRMSRYYIGKVFVLEAAPEETDHNVNALIGNIGANSPLSLLLNFDDDEISDEGRDKLDGIFALTTLSEDTLRKNRSYSPLEQEKIAEMIRQDFEYYRPLLGWSRIPISEQLIPILEFIVEGLDKNSMQKNKIHSSLSLNRLVWSLFNSRSISAFISDRIETRLPNVSKSDSIEESLKIIRNVFCYRLPKALRAVENIVKDVSSQVGRPIKCNYNHFAGQIENLFLDPMIMALDEYGIPVQTSVKLSSLIKPNSSLNEILQIIKNADFERFELHPFELDLLKGVAKKL